MMNGLQQIRLVRMVAALGLLLAAESLLAKDFRIEPYFPGSGDNDFDYGVGTKGGNGPAYFYSAMFYDIEGHVGLLDTYSFRDPRFSARIGLEDGTIRDSPTSAFFSASAPSANIPFWWESKTPWTGIVRGWAKSAFYGEQQVFILPVPASAAGMQLSLGSNTSGKIAMTIHVSLVDDVTTPSPLAFEYMANAGRQCTITAVYLPGNVLSNSVGIESYLYGPFDLLGDYPHIFWGDGWNHNNAFPSDAVLSTIAPVGPLLVASMFDGSTTAMLETVAYDTEFISTHLPYAPLSGSTLPTATAVLEIPQPPAWIMNSTYDAVLLGDSVDLTTDLDVACDRNQDHVIDASDLFLYGALEGERD